MKDDKITGGSLNVFADLGYPDAVERQTKTRLALAINTIIKQRRLRQVQVAKLLRIPQPKVSALKNYRLNGFSVEKLMELLTALNRDIEIMIRARTGRAGAGQIYVHEVM